MTRQENMSCDISISCKTVLIFSLNTHTIQAISNVAIGDRVKSMNTMSVYMKC